MSGPKVVRIVTEEERIAICETQLARLNQAIQKLLAFLKKNGLITDELIKTYEGKYKRYQKVATPDAYTRIRGLVDKEVDYIDAEMNRFIKIAQSEKLKLQNKKSNLTALIKTLRILCDKRGVQFEKDFELGASDIDLLSEANIDALYQRLSIKSSELAQASIQNQTPLTSEQMALEERLANVEDLQAFQWTVEGGKDSFTKRLDELLVQLDLLAPESEEKSGFLDRLDRIYYESASSTRRKQVDSLTMDIAQFVSEAKRVEETKNQLEKIKAELSVLRGEEAKKFLSQIDRAFASGSVSVLETLASKLAEVTHQIIQRENAEIAREKFIASLESFGYKTQQGMQTAVVENGRLVVRSQDSPSYGVEVRQVAESNQFQVRMVSALDESLRDRAKDERLESEWCQDLAKIIQKLHGEGMDLDIRVAKEAGEAPIAYSKVLFDQVNLEKSSQTSSKHVHHNSQNDS